MATLNMEGPFTLGLSEIQAEVNRILPGNYALGYVNQKGHFIVKYVGRSDRDVGKRLMQHIGLGYKHFKFSYASSLLDAYKKECMNYHDFGGSGSLDNEIHPDKPSGYYGKCPNENCSN